MRRRRRRPGHGIDKTEGMQRRRRCQEQNAYACASDVPRLRSLLHLQRARATRRREREQVRQRHVAQLRARAPRLRVGGACAREDGGDAGVRDSAPPPAVHQRRDAGPALPLRGDCAVLKQRCLARALDLAPQVIVVERFDKFRLCAIAVVWERAES
eukprot:gene2320-biopygen11022